MVVIKQHYVPQCYLKNFANKNYLFVWDKIEQKNYRVNILNIAQGRYFNDFPDVFLPQELQDKQKYQIIEDDLSRVEKRFSDFLNQIINCLKEIENKNLFDSCGVLNKNGKNNFSAFISLQLIRTNSMRQQMKRMLQDLTDIKEKWIKH